MKRKTGFLMVLLLFLPVMAAQSAGTDKPEDVIISTVNKVIDRMNEEKELLDAQPEKVYDVINTLIIPNFDFFNMSRFILGKYWKEASGEQRRIFVEEFTTLLVRTYAKALLGYSDEKINHLETLTGSRPEVVLVKTEIVSETTLISTPVNYTMHIEDGNWKVVNVAFEGVSLVETYRKSFASEIRNNGLESLIQKLVDKNEKLVQSLTE